MKKPLLSEHYQDRLPSAIRIAQIEFLKRTDQVVGVNTAIGNVTLPMHPAMVKRMFSLNGPHSPFKQGVVKYSTTAGEKEANHAFLHLIASCGFSTKGLHSQITDGGSHAMELVILGVCGPAGSSEKPLLLIDPTYSNYTSFAIRTGRATVSVTRHLEENGKFSLPKLSEIEKVIVESKPSALLIIPYDNPTGQFFPQQTINDLAKLSVKHNLWLISDEAYREMFYTEGQTSSVWGITEQEVPGITGRRISIESASKAWNACGLRTGAIITDNSEFHQQAVAENTANLCANVIGQYVFGALLHESKEELQYWFSQQRAYYKQMAITVTTGLKEELPQLIVSEPDAALYTVIDMRKVCGPNFDASEFALYCAQKGSVMLNGVKTTLLAAPMDGFYSPGPGQSNPGRTQMRIAYVEPPEVMAEVPKLFAQLLHDFQK
ncbi:MAG: aminotransferase class I/II-fold pyridoxal phosphate-dependent enzyme [Parachlamydiales bacterium]|nr:aminotransferase class I/II-fold pyridoxal phosphate-dependent enzyme [Candidatus Acheromyda pituitae]